MQGRGGKRRGGEGRERKGTAIPTRTKILATALILRVWRYSF